MCTSPANVYLRKLQVFAWKAQVWHIHAVNRAAMTPVAKEGELKGIVKSIPETMSNILTAYGMGL